jgi:hypothetical protein
MGETVQFFFDRSLLSSCRRARLIPINCICNRVHVASRYCILVNSHQGSGVVFRAALTSCIHQASDLSLPLSQSKPIHRQPNKLTRYDGLQPTPRCTCKGSVTRLNTLRVHQPYSGIRFLPFTVTVLMITSAWHFLMKLNGERDAGMPKECAHDQIITLR